MPDIENICELLRIAQQETQVDVETNRGFFKVNMNQPPFLKNQFERSDFMNKCMTEGTWHTTGQGLQKLQDWVEHSWNPETEKQKPNDTVQIGHGPGQAKEIQMDAATATRKLILAASLFGNKQVGKYATEFAAHGMIEGCSFYMLKGVSIQDAKQLDQFCTLVPYSAVLQEVEKESLLPNSENTFWPKSHAGNVCALKVRTYERRSHCGVDNTEYTSPLLLNGPDLLVLLVGLVWGNGIRKFGSWHHVPSPVEAMLPFRLNSLPGGMRDTYVEIPIQEDRPHTPKRPLPIMELRDLVSRFADLPEQTKQRLSLGLRRLCDSVDRIELEDKVIDTCIALEALFMEAGEKWKHKKRISARGSWYFADTVEERQKTRQLLREVYKYRSRIVHGNTHGGLNLEVNKIYSQLHEDAVEVLNTSIKCMIIEGRPVSWEKAKHQNAIRHCPQRPESKIRSVKSDSLSWTVEKQKQIDRTLEEVWRTSIDNAGTPPEGASIVLEHGVSPERVAAYKEQGLPYVIAHPARLYTAHPKWYKDPEDKIDERTEYYCELDVVRHMEKWKEATIKRKLVCFVVDSDSRFYHPKHQDQGPQPLQ